VALRGEKAWTRRLRAILSMAVACGALGLLPAGASAARHFEKVSPADKGLGDIVGDGATTLAAQAGDAVAFSTRTPFGDTVGSGTVGQTQYIARRTNDAWIVNSITPTPRPDARQTFFAGTLLQLYSNDLSTAVLRGYDLPGATDDAPLRNNIYVEDTATRALETVTASQVDQPTSLTLLNYPSPFWGFSADARHVAFVAQPDPFGVVTQYLPEAAPGVPNVYQWDDGVLHVASILPDDTVAANGADSPTNLRGAMSADGSRLLFTASDGVNPAQLYMRIDGTRTVWISENELDRTVFPTNVQVMGMTPDGRNVFFTTDTPLVSDDANGGPDLYRYRDSADPSNDINLTMISENGDLGGGDLLGMSDDGNRVYYLTGGNHLTVWDNGDTTLLSTYVTAGVLGLTAVPGYGRVTPDGMFVVFATDAIVDADRHGLTGEVTNQHLEMYLYSLRDRRLTCCSCPPVPATSDVTVLPAATHGEPTVGNAGSRPRFLSDSGRVFFSTADALVPEDANGVLDTYEYDPVTGEVSLLSTGTGKDASTFADASASGDDVFLVTRQRLVASDRDNLVDLYDVRDGSSLPPEVVGQSRLECEGDGCQPPASGSPPEDQLGSLFFEDGDGAGGSRLFAVRQRIVVHGATGSLPVRLFAAGRLTWSGRGLRHGASRYSRAGSFEVRLRLGRRARVHLRASGTYTTSVRLRFVSAGGVEVERTTRVTFRVAARKGR
jgi:Tol biopolymer transport system component